MSHKDFVYVTDKGTKYLVRLDAAIGGVEALGFFPPKALDGEFDYLPRSFKMRTFGCAVSSKELFPGKSFRTFAVGSSTATILTEAKEFRYKEVGYIPRRYHPEKRRKPQPRS